MIPDPDFFDFITEGGFDLLFPDDEDEHYTCPFCSRVINGNEEVQWIRKRAVFRCPGCGKDIALEK